MATEQESSELEASASNNGSELAADLLRGQVVDVDVDGQTVSAEVIPAARIVEMAELDRKLFGEHKALSEEELRNVNEHGALLAISNETGAMIAEAQVITEAIPGADEPLVRELPPDSGYFEGFAVDPDYRGTSVGIGIERAVEKVIREAGKADAWATVRVENAPSVRNLTKEGYLIVGYSEQYYEGDELSGARLVTRKDLQSELSAQAAMDEALLGATQAIEGQPFPEGDITIALQPGDDIDAAAHQMIKAALDKGLVGVGITRNADGQTLLVFRPKEVVGDDESRERLSQRQQFLHEKGIA